MNRDFVPSQSDGPCIASERATDHFLFPFMSSPLRNIALTVHELEEGEFHWVLVEAPGMEETLPYQPLEASDDAYENYNTALLAGLAAMRRLFGKEGPRS